MTWRDQTASRKQVRLLRQLACRTGLTFTPPHTAGHASDQIKLLIHNARHHQIPYRKLHALHQPTI